MKVIILLSIMIVASSMAWGNNIVQKTNERKFKIKVKTTVEHWGIGDSKTDLFLAYLSTNEYQKCFRHQTDSQAKITHLGEAGDSCIYYDLTLGRTHEFGKKAILNNEFTVETSDIQIDFNAITRIYNYDLCDPNYEKYTGSDYPFINVEQKQLYLLSQTIWASSRDVLDYAEKCYLFVATYFDYGVPESGFKSLDYTLKTRMGDCGNLSSVFITLMRMQHIPARHLMGFRPDGSLHVRADFYLAKYGWIPVDVTYKHDYPQADYFGRIKFENNGFIVQRGIGHEISVLDSPRRITGLQTYTYQVAYTKEDRAKVYIERKVECVEEI